MTAPATNERLDSAPLTLPERPLVSIVIPCLNEESYITALLDSLSAQDYGAEGIEVLVSDGGSTDRTRELVREYRSPFARLELVDNPRKITVAGLNEGMDASRGDCWIIIGAHSKVRADFVRESVAALRRMHHRRMEHAVRGRRSGRRQRARQPARPAQGAHLQA